MLSDSLRRPFSLTGRYVELVPVGRDQAEALRAAAHDPEAYRFVRLGPGSTRADIDGLIEELLKRQAGGWDLPFTTRLLADHRVIGMTRYLNIRREDNAVEVGGTWLDTSFWRTPVNTETKYLLFRHAFEREKCHRVVLQTDLRNERSARAIARLGAVREGVHREDSLLTDGTYRSSVFFSVLATEWPAVKSRLEAYLAQPWSQDSRPTPSG
jgi:N-acetyltransferase